MQQSIHIWTAESENVEDERVKGKISEEECSM